MSATPKEIFELGRVIYEARVREAWGWAGLAQSRLDKLPYPKHIGAPREADVDLAIVAANAVVKAGWIKPEIVE